MQNKKEFKSYICYSLILIIILAVLLNVSETMYVKADDNVQFDIDNPPKNEIEKLYYGYNVTGGKDLMEPDALRTTFPIIDPNSDYNKYIKAFTGTKGDGKSYYGHNHKEVVNNYVQEQIFSAYGDIYMVSAEVSTKFKTQKKVSNAYTEWYEIYTKWINRHYYVVQLSINEIKQYLSQRFKDDLYSIKDENDAKRILETYGTHLNTGYQFGGRMIITNYMSSTQDGKAYEGRMEIGERLQIQYGVDLGENGSFSEEELTQEQTDFDSTSYSCVIYGGDSNIPQRVEDLFQKNTALVTDDNTGFYYTKWENSINKDKNLAIIGIPNGAQSIPIWKLLDENDPQSADIQQCLVNVYLKMCGDKYEEYEKLYPYLEKTVSKSNKETAVSIKSAYVGTPNSYFYKVDLDDFNSDGQHYGIHSENYLYLNLSLDYGPERKNPEYECQNCRAVDEKKGIFKVTGTTGNCKIIAKTGDIKKTLLDVPIISCSYEGGMGNEDYPYIVVNVNQFKAISENRNAYYKLFSDIDFGGAIISSFGNFDGELDGNYCSISNFMINNAENWGLFGINTGTIKNLKISRAGTSLDSKGFSEGGVNYCEDYKYEEDKDDVKKFETNSIYAKNAGILCSENKGTISNCYFSDIFIRNIIRNRIDYVRNYAVNVCVGIITGINNNGELSQCVVKDSRILDVFICDEGISIDVGTYAGGLAGYLHGGEIDACIYDSGSTGTIMSLVVMEFDNGDPTPSGNTINAYSGGIAGFCDGNSTVKSSYSYIRNIPGKDSYQAVDAEYIILDWWDSRADHRHALRSASMICDEKISIDAEYNFAYTGDINTLECACISPTENGNIRSDKNIYRSIGYFSEKKIYNKEDFNNMNLQKTNIRYDEQNISHFSHILALERSQYIKIDEEKNENNKNLTECYIDDRYTPYNINLKIQYGDNNVEDLKIFRMYIRNSNGANYLIPRNWKLSENNGDKYYVQIYPYANDTISFNSILNMNINNVSYIKIKTEDKDKYTIYLDEVQKYFDFWSLDNIELYRVMSDGKEYKIEGEEAKKLVSVVKKVDDISVGENIVEVNYKTDRDVLPAKYILNVKKRDVVSMEITKAPTKTTYKVGGDEKIDLHGMEVLVKYTEGEKLLSDSDDIKKFEIIGSVSSIGDNTVYLSYGNYNKTVELKLTGIENTDFEPMPKSTPVITILLIFLAIGVCIVGVVFGMKFINSKKVKGSFSLAVNDMIISESKQDISIKKESEKETTTANNEEQKK